MHVPSEAVVQSDRPRDSTSGNVEFEDMLRRTS